jgi:phosphoglycerate dehydrogenase-like enzyme
MPAQPRVVWSNFGVPAGELQRIKDFLAKSSVEFRHDPGERSPRLDGVDVVFGQPSADSVVAARTVRWVQVSSAGITRYDTGEFRSAMTGRGTVFTNSSSIFDEPCAEHVAAMILAMARQLPMALDDQRGGRKWLSQEMHDQSRRLKGQTVLIYGFGAIGRKLAGYLTAFEMAVTGVRRSPKGDEGVPVVTTEQADGLLGRVDHVVNILPSSKSSDGFFDPRRIGLMSKDAMFYNIGRGATVDQPALVEALQARRIRGAYLDVTSPEPLPADHVLWTLPNCWITPHSAGGHADESRRLCQHFMENFERYIAGKPLADRVI